jgi:hypothetical protein
MAASAQISIKVAQGQKKRERLESAPFPETS